MKALLTNNTKLAFQLAVTVVKLKQSLQLFWLRSYGNPHNSRQNSKTITKFKWFSYRPEVLFSIRVNCHMRHYSNMPDKQQDVPFVLQENTNS